MALDMDATSGAIQFAKEVVEFHAVVLAHGDSGSLYPLTDDMPVCLLPVAGRPLLFYQLEAFRANGITDVTLMVADAFSSQVKRFLSDYKEASPRGTHQMSIHVVLTDFTQGSAEALTQIKDRLTCKNFIVVPASLMVAECLCEVLDQHRSRKADCTIAFRQPVQLQPGAKPKKQRERDIDEDTEVVGLTSEGRVVIKSPMLEMEESGMCVSKFLLGKNAKIQINTELADPHLYVLASWVLPYLEQHREMVDIRQDLLPHLVQRQFQPRDQDSEFWEKYKEQLYDNDTPEEDEELADSLNPIQIDSILFSGNTLCHGAENIQAYFQLNKEIIASPRVQLFGQLQGLRRRDQTVVGKDCQLGQKVNIKGSVLGDKCSIGTKAKINNCIIMDNVRIGDNCTVQNCVISSSAVIEEDCNLNDCQVGMLTHITKGTKSKGEQFTRAG
mmetsp:Transcript_22976/g.29996  ORF Transcript_22976/g.29996 Transcript_22976/m.29996 type:complete len:443 (-) Transcript_22976:66-1394(-)